ncbi:hypothetical protein TNCV_2279791 [Trichonephila clavipes]|uniref:Uncharacterized protein n=1 Tax=Trichonephila clavipes TaxID=2585209 RepID=A0A8X6R4Z2_TRICX|nr:hypothetical protein TNCV_2279791 [Trichonephila clavipes]
MISIWHTRPLIAMDAQHTQRFPLPGEVISSSTGPIFVGAKARSIITRLSSDPYHARTAFSNSASLPPSSS